MPRPTRIHVLAALVACALILGACANDGDTRGSRPPGDVALEALPVVEGLTLPVHLAAPADDPRLFVVEQPGRIRVVRDGVLLPVPFLDITDRVRSGGERGLLSVAFHPRYAENGHLFVNYTGVDPTNQAERTIIERYTVSADSDRADRNSAFTLLEIAQPFSNHNGGLCRFGPDGYLYIGMGDGGSGGDPQDNGQNRSTLLGKLLRIDVDGAVPYAIPADNPYRNDPVHLPEIWAWGLRNPWRFDIDPVERRLFIADVGQNLREEIDVADLDAGGLNYGWKIMEGDRCYASSDCDRAGLTLPALAYANPGDGCSVIGGYVYRGTALPELQGHYLYADFCRKWVRSFRYVDGAVTDEREWDLNVGAILSFGRDASGELYLLCTDGRVYRIRRAA